MLLIDKWGRKPIQLMGFAMLTAIFICMGEFSFNLGSRRPVLDISGFGYEKLIASNEGKKAFVFLYCLANFFQNFVSFHSYQRAVKSGRKKIKQSRTDWARDLTLLPSSFPEKSSPLDTDQQRTVSPPLLENSVLLWLKWVSVVSRSKFYKFSQKSYFSIHTFIFSMEYLPKDPR